MKQYDELTNAVIKYLKTFIIIDYTIIFIIATSLIYYAINYPSTSRGYYFIYALGISIIIWSLISSTRSRKELRNVQGESK